MTEDEIKLFAGSPLQQLMIREHKRRLTEIVHQFLSADVADLVLLRAAMKAAYASLLDISVTEADIARLSAELVDQMEETRKTTQGGLEELVRRRREEMSPY